MQCRYTSRSVEKLYAGLEKPVNVMAITFSNSSSLSVVISSV